MSVTSSIIYETPKLFQSFDYQLITYTSVEINTIVFQSFSVSPLYGIILVDKSKLAMLYNGKIIEDSIYTREQLKQLLQNIHYETEFCNNQYLETLLENICNSKSSSTKFDYIESWQKTCDYISKFKQDSRMLTTSTSIKLYKYLNKPVKIIDIKNFPDLYILQHPEIINRYLIIQYYQLNKYNIVEVEIFYKPGNYQYGYMPNIRYSVRYFDCSPENYKYILDNAHKIIHNYCNQKQDVSIIYTPYNHNQDNSLDIDLVNLNLQLSIYGNSNVITN